MARLEAFPCRGIVAAIVVGMLALVPSAGNASHQSAKNGCTSATTRTATLISEPIQLPTSGPTSIRFDTWWEIESIDPVEHDVMTAEISIDDGATWLPLTRLNPSSSQPAALPDIPVSNIGQQQRPDWQQGGVSVPLGAEFDAQTARLRFTFNSFDTLFNGFRGWAIDNVQVLNSVVPVFTQNFESTTTWSFEAPWRVVAAPESIFIDARINDPLVTLAESDPGNLPSHLGGPGSYAWFGDGTGTFCGEDFAVGLSLEPPFDEQTTGATQVVTAQTEETLPESLIHWERSGANPGQGTVSPDQLGSAQISWVGANSGSDTLSVHFDRNGDQIQGPGEPVQLGFYGWTVPGADPPPDPPAPPDPPPAPLDPPPVTPSQPQQPLPPRPLTIEDLPNPEPFREVNIEPIEGQVYVRLPGGSARASQSGAPRGFVPLSQAAQVPVRSIVDTSRGKVKMESAATASGRSTQTADFFDGQFQIIQKRARRPVTEMVLKGGSFRRCPRARQSASWSRANDAQRRRRSSRVRRLWGNGRGRFRTRGRYSSATVRGTTWLVEDRCDGTLTRLPRRPRTSVVDVRDLSRRRTIRLRAGRSYLARPRAARRR